MSYTLSSSCHSDWSLHHHGAEEISKTGGKNIYLVTVESVIPRLNNTLVLARLEQFVVAGNYMKSISVVYLCSPINFIWFPFVILTRALRRRVKVKLTESLLGRIEWDWNGLIWQRAWKCQERKIRKSWKFFVKRFWRLFMLFQSFPFWLRLFQLFWVFLFVGCELKHFLRFKVNVTINHRMHSASSARRRRFLLAELEMT